MDMDNSELHSPGGMMGNISQERQRFEPVTPQIRVHTATHSRVTSCNASHLHSTELQTKALTSTATSEGTITHKSMKTALDSIQCDGNGNKAFGFTEQHRSS